MIYELRTYQLHINGIPKFNDLVKNGMVPVVSDYGLAPLGMWHTEIGPLNEVVHLWAYNDLNERREKWARADQDERRQKLLDELDSVIIKMDNKIMTPFEFSPMQ